MEDSCRNLILEYLLHNCYGNAAKAFISDMRNLDMLNMDTSMLDKNGNVIHNLSGNNTSGTSCHTAHRTNSKAIYHEDVL